MATINSKKPLPVSASNLDETKPVTRRRVTSQLPSINNNELLQKFFAGAADHLFQPESTEILSGYIGQRPTYFDKVSDFYIAEDTKERQTYQLDPIAVSKDTATNDINYSLFYEDIINLLRFQGGITNNHDRLFNTEYYSWAPPIQIDMFLNYQNYFWLPESEDTVDTDLPDYIVIERGSIDGSRWSNENRWYHFEDLTAEQLTLAEGNRAKRPIIQFKKDIELYNYGITRRDNVTVRDNVTTNPTSLIGSTSSLIIDGYTLENGDTILFTNASSFPSNTWDSSQWDNEIPPNGSWDTLSTVSYSSPINDITLDNSVGSNKGTIFTTSGDFVTSGFTAGMTISLNGTTNSNGTYTIEMVTNDTIFLNETFVNVVASQPEAGNITINQIIIVYENRVFEVNGIGTGLTLTLTNIGADANGFPEDGDIILVENGTVYGNNEYYWDSEDETWVLAQSKTVRNTPPLFQLYDGHGVKLQDPGKYPNSTFAGSLIFSYQENTNTSLAIDTELDIRLSFDQFGEILFENVLEQERYNFMLPAEELQGFYYYRIKALDENNDVYGNGWHNVSHLTRQFLLEDFVSIDDQDTYVLDATPNMTYTVTITQNGNELDDTLYSISGKTVTFNSAFTANDYVRVRYYSDEAPAGGNAVYEIPLNLQANPDNLQVDTLSRSDYFTHFTNIIKNQIGLTGSANGSNNYRSTSQDLSLGTEILQHQSSLLNVMYLGMNSNTDFMKSVRYAEREYSRFKNKFLRKIESYTKDTTHTSNQDPQIWMEDAITEINLAKSTSFPFAFSGMGTLSSGDPTYIPPSPSRLGIYPVYQPEKYLDTTFITPRNVLQLHDGSLLIAYNDFRDDVILELEQNIFDSIPEKYRTQHRPQFDYIDYIDSEFRDSDYSYEEFSALLTPIIERWAAFSGINIETNDIYNIDNPFTWNYSSDSGPGYWRGIFKNVYDTDRPNTHPWEMFGFSIKPAWWEDRYGPRPYRFNNPFLWEDMKNGFIADGEFQGTYAKYARPTAPIPVDNDGNLYDPAVLNLALSPSAKQAQKNWKVGDHGPVETLFRRSEYWSFAVAQISYLMKPAKFIEVCWDSNNHEYHYSDEPFKQWVDSAYEKRITNSLEMVHGEVVDGSTYESDGIQQWISDYVLSNGQDITTVFGKSLRETNVQLGHKMAGFISSDSTKILADNLSSPVPNEDINISLYQNPSIREEFYGGVIVEKRDNGFVVSGYDVLNGKFHIFPCITTGKKVPVTIGVYKVTECQEYDASTVVTVPYGTTFKKVQQVYDFLIGYGKWLESRGWIFDGYDSDANAIENWSLSAKQFLFWAQGNWAAGSIIALSPGSRRLKFVTEHGEIQSLEQIVNGVYSLLSRDGVPIQPKDTFISRLNNEITILPSETQSVYAARLFVAENEHVVIFNNKTIFSDLLYDPLYNLRQSRLRLYTARSKEWSGRIDAPGFIVTEDGLTPNFEKTVKDMNRYFDVEDQTEREIIRETARRLVGFQTRDYLDSLLIGPVTQFQFYQGFIRQKGAQSALTSLLRSDIASGNDSVQFFEEWALRLGDFGNADNYNSFDLSLLSSQQKENPQLIEFMSSTLVNELSASASDTSIELSDVSKLPQSGILIIDDEFIKYNQISGNQPVGVQRGVKDSTVQSHSAGTIVGLYDNLYDSVITVSPTDPRWIIKPKQNGIAIFPKRDYTSDALKRSPNGDYYLRSDNFVAGYVFEDEVRYRFESIAARDEFIGEVITNTPSLIEFGDQIWVDNVGYVDSIYEFNFGFMVFTYSNTGLLPIAISELAEGPGDNITLKLDSLTLPDSSQLTAGSQIIIEGSTGTTPSLNGVHTIISIVSLINNEIELDIPITNSDSIDLSNATIGYYTESRFKTESARDVATGNDSFDNIQATLAVGISEYSSTLTLISLNGLKAPGIIKIDSEEISYDRISGNELIGIGRGVNGTIPAEHLAGSIVSRVKTRYSYVDNLVLQALSDPVPFWKVHKTEDIGSVSNPISWTVIRKQETKTASERFSEAILYNNESKIIDARLQIFDPAKGLYPGQALSEVTFKTEYDPAKYNNGDANSYQIDEEDSWGELQVGMVWWDVSTVEYEDYESGTNIERRNKWGRLAPSRSIDIYEWVRSPVPPTQWASYVQENAEEPESNFSYKPSGEAFRAEDEEGVPFVERITTNTRTGEEIIRYYFWVKNSETIPNIENREQSVATIARQMTNPTSQGISWFAPINSNAIIVSNVDNLLSGDDSVIQFNYGLNNDVSQHREWLLTRSGDSKDVPRDRYWNKMRDSLVNFDMNYNAVPDPNLEEARKYGNYIRPRQTWFVDSTKAGEIFFNAINSLFINQNIVDRTNALDNLFNRSTEPTPYGPTEQLLRPIEPNEFNDPLGLETDNDSTSSSIYHVSDLDERNNLVITNQVSLGEQIWVDATPATDNFWKIYKVVGDNTVSDINNAFEEVNSESYRVEDFWSYADYYAEGYSSDTIADYEVDTLTERDALVDVALGEIVLVNDTNDDNSNIWSLYILQNVNEVDTYVEIGKKNSTIQFNVNLLFDATYGNNDISHVNTDFPTGVPGRLLAIKEIIDALRTDIMTDLEQNIIFFKMINYVHSEQLLVDWAFKTTYFIGVGLNRNVSQKPILSEDRVQNFIEFLQEAKPYHTKLRDFRTVENLGVDIFESNMTDFDKPVYFDEDTEMYRVLDINNSTDITILEDENNVQNDWYSVYENEPDLVRHFSMSILFDRVSCDVSGGWDPIFGWDNEANNGWDLDLPENKTAADRILASLQPDPLNQAGLDENKIDKEKSVANLISGCNFRATIIDSGSHTDLLQQPIGGWSAAVWSTSPWSPLASGANVIDISEYDVIYDGGPSNFKGLVPTYTADGSTDTFGVTGYVIGDLIAVFVDGNLQIEGTDYHFNVFNEVVFNTPPIENQTIQIGIYANPTFEEASVSSLSDIIVDGNLFKQPYIDNNHPEELALGAVGESVNITIMHPEYNGMPNLLTRTFTANGLGPYDIGQTPASADAVFVYINGLLASYEGTADYTINFSNNTVTFNASTNITNADRITIVSFNTLGGIEVLEHKTFTGNGITASYTLDTVSPTVSASLVTVDGVIQTGGVDFNFGVNQIVFTAPPANNSKIDITIFDSSMFTQITNTEYEVNGAAAAPTINTYSTGATATPEILGSADNVIVSVNGIRQRPKHTVLPESSQEFDYTVNYGSNSIVFNVKITSIPNPTIVPGETIIIDGNSVSFTGSTVASAVTDINNAGISNIVAYKSQIGNMLIISNYDTGSSITVSGTSLANLGIVAGNYKTILSDNDEISIIIVKNDFSEFNFEYNGLNTFIIPHDLSIPEQVKVFVNGSPISVANYNVNVIDNTVTILSSLTNGDDIDIAVYYTSTDTYNGNSGGEYLVTSQNIYDERSILVHINGIKQEPTVDYTIENNNTIKFNNGQASDDEIVITALTGRAHVPASSFNIWLNAVSAQKSNDITANLLTTLKTAVIASATTIETNNATGFESGIITLSSGTSIEKILVRESTMQSSTSNGVDSIVLSSPVTSIDQLSIRLDSVEQVPNVDFTFNTGANSVEGLDAGEVEITIFYKIENTFYNVIRGYDGTTPIAANIGSNIIGLDSMNGKLATWEGYRILSNNRTTLAQPLNLGDTSIELSKVAGLPKQKTGETRMSTPGAIWIGGERIEFYERDGTTLKQIVRGTHGTSVGIIDTYDSNGRLIQDHSRLFKYFDGGDITLANNGSNGEITSATFNFATALDANGSSIFAAGKTIKLFNGDVTGNNGEYIIASASGNTLVLTTAFSGPVGIQSDEVRIIIKNVGSKQYAAGTEVINMSENQKIPGGYEWFPSPFGLQYNTTNSIARFINGLNN